MKSFLLSSVDQQPATVVVGSRRKARELSLQILFQINFSRQNLKEVLNIFWKENNVTPEVSDYANKIVEGTLRNLKEIDSLIEGCSTNWKLSRMAAVDRNLLRGATFELVYLEDIPSSVTINEAVEIAKKFGTEESPSFINGVLDKIAKENSR